MFFLKMNIIWNIIYLPQLHRQLGRTEIFKGYSEAEIQFQPTYKYDINSDDWDTR